MFYEPAMKFVSLSWLRAASWSLLVSMTSGAVAQTAPATAGGASAAPNDASAVQKNDPAPTKEQCIESHRGAQQAQNEGRLVHARELARTCTSLVCPGLVITDCARWLNDLDQRIPSVVFEVRVDGQPNLSAMIIADGKRVQEWTRGEALRLDPGEHQFRFELAPYQPVIQKFLLAEGMRYRIVTAEFKSQAQPLAAPRTTTPAAPVTSTEPPAVPMARPVPFAVYPLLGVGAIGAASFTVFSLLGKSKQSDLESSCKPNCNDSDLDSMKTKYLIGDISLGVGAASLITAGVLYLARPERPMVTSVGFAPMPGGASGFATYQF